jgi:DNA-directed RNA polymerase specialized sigma subunit
MYYFEDKTLLEIGNIFGVTREAIRQNIQKGIKRIRAYV